jgi:hypothetical protein
MAVTGRTAPRSRSALARRQRFSARRTNLSSRFRSVWVWIAVTRMTEALEDVQSRHLKQAGHRPAPSKDQQKLKSLLAQTALSTPDRSHFSK